MAAQTKKQRSEAAKKAARTRKRNAASKPRTPAQDRAAEERLQAKVHSPKAKSPKAKTVTKTRSQRKAAVKDTGDVAVKGEKVVIEERPIRMTGQAELSRRPQDTLENKVVPTIVSGS